MLGNSDLGSMDEDIKYSWMMSIDQEAECRQMYRDALDDQQQHWDRVTLHHHRRKRKAHAKSFKGKKDA